MSFPAPVVKSPGKGRDPYLETVVDPIEGDIGTLVRGDRDLLDFGRELWEMKSCTAKSGEDVRRKLRDLARFQIELRKREGRQCIVKNYLRAHYVDNIILKIKELTGYHVQIEGARLENPSLARAYCLVLENYAQYLSHTSIKLGDFTAKDRYDMFLHVMKRDSGFKIKKIAEITEKVRGFNKKVLLPSTRAIRKLFADVECHLQRLLEVESWDDDNLTDAAKHCIVKLLLFNRRRVGEIDAIRKSDVENIKSALEITEASLDEVVESLTQEDHRLLRDYKLFESMGKNYKKVYTLIDPSAYACMVRLSRTQTERRNKQNPFLFATSYLTMGHLRGDKALADVKNKYMPDVHLTGTILRKHAASTAATFNLGSESIRQLADHLSHGTDIHYVNYRISDRLSELTKVNRLLHDLAGLGNSEEHDDVVDVAITTSTRPSASTSTSNQSTTSTWPQPFSTSTSLTSNKRKTRYSDDDDWTPEND